MNQPSTEQLKKTPLNARHRAHGARMVPFGGWDMPVEYSGIVNEHMAVRTRAGLFDVSHMGRDRGGGEGCPRRGTAHLHQRRREVERRPGAVLGADDAGRHLPRRFDRLSFSGRSLSARRECRQHREGVQVDRRRDPRGWRRRRRQLERAIRAVGRSRPGGTRNRSATHGCRSHRSEATTGSPTAKSRGFAASSRARGTRAKTGSSCSSRPQPRSACGIRFSKQARRPESCLSVSARATRCAWKPACTCRGRTWTRRRPCSRPISAGLSAGRSTTSSARRRWTSRKRLASRASSSDLK